MAKYCGVISVGAIAGGGEVVSTTTHPVTGVATVNNAIPIAVELVSFQIGETFFRKIRVCQQFVSQFIHPGDDACIYVYKQMGITNVIVGVKSNQYPSYSISFGRLLLMLFSQYFFGFLFSAIPTAIVIGMINRNLFVPGLFIGALGLPSYGAWTLIQAYREMMTDFK